MTDAAEKTDQKDAPRTFREKAVQEAKEWGIVFAWFIPLYFLFTGLVYEQRVIPSESMVPNLQVGDRVAVNKFTYGYSRHSVPFSLGRYLPLPGGRIFARTPKPGDVVVFEHPHTSRVMIKRVIGVPGDRIEIVDEQLFVNGAPVRTEQAGRVNLIQHRTKSPVAVRQRIETLGDKTYMTHQFSKGSDLDTAGPFVVPDGHLFFMGDNRDDSLDARNASGHCLPVDGVISGAGCPPRKRYTPQEASVGFVPLENVIGRADTVIFTTKRCKWQTGISCPPKRLWRGL